MKYLDRSKTRKQNVYIDKKNKTRKDKNKKCVDRSKTKI